MPTSVANAQQRVWEVIEVIRPDDALNRVFNQVLLGLIIANVIAYVLGTVQSVQRRFGLALDVFEFISVIVFTLEYVARLWSCVADSRYRHAFFGRLRLAIHPLSVADFLAIAPFYLVFLGIDLRYLRAARLLRLLRVAKLGRYSRAVDLISRVFRRRHEEIVATSFLVIGLLFVSACLVQHFEHEAQPKAFADVPSTLWWAVVTLTTIGYGDVVPITPLGRFFTSIMALLGLGLCALPAAVISAGLVDEFRQEHKADNCPHCGGRLR